MRSLPALLLAVVLLPAPLRAADRAASDPEALRLARQVMRALGGREAWNDTRHLAWSFFGRRVHVWDRVTGDLRTEWPDGRVVLMNLRTGAGRVVAGGVDLQGEDLEEALEQARATWINDSYWLLMPYKLLDPGVTLRDLGRSSLPDGRPAEVLELTFERVGVTPWNKYHVWIDAETRLPDRWAYYTSAGDAEPRFVLPFAGWRRHGRILLPHDHGRGSDWDAEVFRDLPETVHSQPGSFLGMETLRRVGTVAEPVPPLPSQR